MPISEYIHPLKELFNQIANNENLMPEIKYLKEYFDFR